MKDRIYKLLIMRRMACSGQENHVQYFTYIYMYLSCTNLRRWKEGFEPVLERIKTCEENVEGDAGGCGCQTCCVWGGRDGG